MRFFIIINVYASMFLGFKAGQTNTNAALIYPSQSDSLFLESKGKVYSVIVLDSVVCYKYFLSEIPETDVGVEYFKVEKNGKKLWEKQIQGTNIILCSAGNVVFINIDNQTIASYVLETGVEKKKIHIEKKFQLTDVNEAILISDKLIFTLIDQTDFKVIDIVLLDLKTYKFTPFGLELAGYYHIKKSKDDKSVLLLDQNNKVVLKISI